MSFHDLDLHQQKKHRWLNVSDCNVDAQINEVIVLTFNIDWACDVVLADCIELAETSGAPATWFVTHDTQVLESLRVNNKFELTKCIPNTDIPIQAPIFQSGHSESGIIFTTLSSICHAVVFDEIAPSNFDDKFLPNKNGVRMLISNEYLNFKK